jgi:hypothetical protein
VARPRCHRILSQWRRRAKVTNEFRHGCVTLHQIVVPTYTRSSVCKSEQIRLHQAHHILQSELQQADHHAPTLICTEEMEDPLEYDLLPLPWEITHRIVLACRRDVSVKQLGNLRLLNKTWKATIDASIFGPHGRLMCSQKSTRFAMLVGAPCGVNKVSVRPAVGLLDERCRNVYICPVPSSNSLSLDGRSLEQGGGRISLLNKSIYILEEGCDSAPGNLEPVQSTRWLGCTASSQGNGTQSASRREPETQL